MNQWSILGPLLLSLAFLPGCVLFPERLDEVTVLAVEPVALSRGSPDRPWPPVPALRVTFTAEKNLEWFGSHYSLPIGSLAALCNGNELDWDSRLSAIGVYNAATGRSLSYLPPEQRGLPNEARQYFLYLPERTDGQRLTLRNQPGYRWRDHDLRQDPVDVCIQLRGGNPALVWFYSNVVRIPAETIRAALARAPAE